MEILIVFYYFIGYPQAKKETKNALAQPGFTKSASSDQLGLKPVDPAKLEVSSSVLFRVEIVL